MRETVHRLSILAIFGLLMGISTPASAKCAVLSLCSCSVSASGVAFGSYDPFSSTPTTSSGTITVNCVLVVALAGSYDIALSSGSSGTYSSRKMTKGGSSLGYNLYTSPGLTQIWGDGSGGSTKITPSFNALLAMNQTSNVYGEIPARQNVPAGTYGDTIIITITY